MASFDFITHVLEVSCQAIPYSFVSARQLLHGEQSLELSKPPYTHNMYAAYYTQCIVFAHRCMLGFFSPSGSALWTIAAAVALALLVSFATALTHQHGQSILKFLAALQVVIWCSVRQERAEETSIG